MRLRARGDKDEITFQPTRASRTCNGDRVRIFERGLAANEFDLVEREILQDALAFHIHNFTLVVHKVVDGEVLFERVVDAVQAALLQARKIKRGFTKRFARNGAGVDAAPAHVLGALDDRDALAKVSGLGATLFTGGTAADDD